MTVNANQWGLTLVCCFMHLMAAAQIVFPTKEDHERKVDSFQTVLKTAKEDTNKVKTLLAIGEELLYWSDEELPKSLKYLKNSLELAEKLGYENEQVEALLLLSSYSSRSEDHQSAIKFSKDALAIAHARNDYLKISKCYNWLGGAYQSQKQYDEALANFNTGLDFAFRSGEKSAIIASYSQLARFYMDNDKPGYPQAIRYYLMVLKIAEEISNIDGIHESLNNTGLMYTVLEDYEQALNCYKQLEKKTASKTFIGNYLMIYRGLKDYQGGINEINDFIARAQKQGIKSKLATGAYLLGDTYKLFAEDLSKNKRSPDSINFYLNKAIASFDRAQQIKKELGDPYVSFGFEYGSLYKMKAKLISKSSGPKDTLIKYVNISLRKLSEQLKDTASRTFSFYKAPCYVNIGEVTTMQGDLLPGNESIKKYYEALNYLDTALSLGKKNANQEVVRDAYYAKAEIFRKLKNYDRSYEAMRFYDEVKDSIKASETRKKIEQMRIANITIQGTIEEKARYDNRIKDMQTSFLKKEDSLAFQRALADQRFNQQQKEFQLQQAQLTIANNLKELNLFKYLKSQAELENELVKRQEKEKALTIANQEKSLQQNQLQLQKTQIDLKESQIQAQNRQRQIYLGGFTIMSLLFAFGYLNIRSRQKTERLVAAERLRSEKAIASHQMAELELQSLRAQLNPHFMFNSLNAIQELILKEDTEHSHLYLSRFSELLRMLLDNSNQAFLPLNKEIGLLDLYLSLEKLRIPDLKYSIDIDPSIDTSEINIPNMILQPYIENAIWHGLSHKKGERNLNIRINKQGDTMVCEIEDNGVGRKTATELKSLYRKKHHSKGMELLSKRFALLSNEFGAGIHSSIDDLYHGDTPAGTRVTIRIPVSLTEQPNTAYA